VNVFSSDTCHRRFERRVRRPRKNIRFAYRTIRFRESLFRRYAWQNVPLLFVHCDADKKMKRKRQQRCCANAEAPENHNPFEVVKKTVVPLCAFSIHDRLFSGRSLHVRAS